MRIRHLLLSLGILALALSGHSQPFHQPQFAHQSSDLKADERVRFGQLDNGLRYAVLANAEPKQRSSLRLVIMAGSLHEAEDQRGLAHFLEHMAFNGSTHYPPSTLIEFFQRMGMSFGQDTNAYTSFDHTVYMLELPDSAKETMTEGFRVFTDYAAGLLLLEDEIKKERGIILSERRARDSVEFRQMVAEFEFLLAKTIIPRRMPIGTAEVISSAPRERFLDFYNHYYRPDRMAVVAVGDFDAETVEKQLQEAFSNLSARGGDPQPLELGTVESADGIRAKYHYDVEAAATSVSIQTVTPYSPEPDTAERRLELLPRDLAVSMLNRRLAILAKKENAPFIRGYANSSYGLNYFQNSSIELTCKPEQWQPALALAEQELRRALEFGFDAAELREATANFINSLEQSVQTASTRRSQALARELTQCLVNGEVFTTPAADLELYGPALKSVTPEQCQAALKEAFSARGRFVSVMGNAKIEAPDSPEAAIAAVYQEAIAVALDPAEQLLDSTFAYTEFGTPGKIADQQHVDDLNLDLLRFENDVRLNIKKTDFEAGRIHLNIRIGTGQLTEPKTKPGLAIVASSTFTAGGLGKHNVDDLQRILAGKTVGLGFRASADALVFNASTNQTDLLLQLQLITAFLTDPGYREESLRMARKRFEPMYQQLEHTPNGPLQKEVPKLLASGDPRFGLPPKEVLFERDLAETRAWLDPQLKDGAVEIAIVGALDPAKTIEAVSQTLGTLPPRSKKPALEEARKVQIPAEPMEKEFTVVTDIPKGVVTLHWPTTDARDIKRTRRLNLLSNVLTDRLRVEIREELGESYSPDASSSPDPVYRDYGFMYTYVTVDPEKAKAVSDAVVRIADELAKGGITDDEFTRAKKPLLTSLRETERTNSYWLYSVLSSAQEYPEHLDWSRSRYSDTESIDKAEVETLARMYLPAERAFRFTVIPQPK